MKYEFKNDFKATYSLMTPHLGLKLDGALMLVQDLITEYFKLFNTDNIYEKEHNQALWVVAKTKMHFSKQVEWLDILHSDTFTSLVKPIRVHTEAIFKNDNGEEIFTAIQESCPIDLLTRKIRKISTLNYPKDMECEKSNFLDDFRKLNTEFDREDKIYFHKVMFNDLDFSNHTNNVKYLEFALDSLPSSFYSDKMITDIEIHYISESKEGELLDIYNKKISEDEIEFLISRASEDVSRVYMKYKKI